MRPRLKKGGASPPFFGKKSRNEKKMFPKSAAEISRSGSNSLAANFEKNVIPRATEAAKFVGALASAIDPAAHKLRAQSDTEYNSNGELASIGEFFNPLQFVSDEESKIIRPDENPEKCGTFTLRDGYFGFAIAVAPSLFGMGDGAANAVAEILNECYDPTAKLQILTYTSPDISNFTEPARLQIKKNSQIAWAVGNFLPDYYQMCAVRDTAGRETQFPYHDRIVILSYRAKPNAFVGEIEDGVVTKKLFERMADLRRKACSSLSGAGFGCSPMGPKQLIRAMSTMINRGKNASWLKPGGCEYDLQMHICDQIADPGVEVSIQRLNKKMQYIEKNEPGRNEAISVLRVKSYDIEVDQRYANFLSGDVWAPPRVEQKAYYNPNLITTTFSFANQKMSTKKAKGNRWVHLFNETFSKMRRLAKESQDGINEIENTLDQIERGETYVDIATTIVIFSTKDRVETDTENTLKLFNQSRNPDSKVKTEIVRTSNDIDHFLHALPFGSCERYQKSHFNRSAFHLCTSRVAGWFAPLCGDYSGFPSNYTEAGILCTGRSGQMGLIDYHVGDSEPNALVMGSSGAGKSFCVTHFILASLARNFLIRLIEEGGSSKRATKVLEGEYIDIEEHNRVFSFNPFLSLKGIEIPKKYNPNDYKGVGGENKKHVEYSNIIESIIAQVIIMCTPPSGSQGQGKKVSLSDRQQAIIRSVVPSVAREKRQKAHLDDIVEALHKFRLPGTEDRPNEDAQFLALALEPYCGDGHLAHWFSSDDGISWENQLVGFDLKSLSNLPQLKAVVLINICLAIFTEISDKKLVGTKKLIIIDEGWALIKDEGMVEFVEKLFRQIRKHGGSIVIATQSVADILDSPACNAIMTNAQKKYFLWHNLDNQSIVKSKDVLGDAEDNPTAGMLYKYLQGIEVEKNARYKYSEILIYLGQSQTGGAIRFSLPQFFRYLYATDDDTVSKMNEISKRYEKSGMSHSDIFVKTLEELGMDDEVSEIRLLKYWIDLAKVEFSKMEQ